MPIRQRRARIRGFHVPSQYWGLIGSVQHEAVLGGTVEQMVKKVLRYYPFEENEERPSAQVIDRAIKIVEGLKEASQPEVSASHRELELSWTNGRRSVRLLACNDGTFKIHKYESRVGGVGGDDTFIADVNPKTLRQSLRWLEPESARMYATTLATATAG